MKRHNNKGFTLVELIIVIAIIAILAAVLAPQYLRYVEETRETNDIAFASALLDASLTVSVDTSLDAPVSFDVTWECTSGGDIIVDNVVGGSMTEGEVRAELIRILASPHEPYSNFATTDVADGGAGDLLLKLNADTFEIDSTASSKWHDTLN